MFFYIQSSEVYSNHATIPLRYLRIFCCTGHLSYAWKASALALMIIIDLIRLIPMFYKSKLISFLHNTTTNSANNNSIYHNNKQEKNNSHTHIHKQHGLPMPSMSAPFRPNKYMRLVSIYIHLVPSYVLGWPRSCIQTDRFVSLNELKKHHGRGRHNVPCVCARRRCRPPPPPLYTHLCVSVGG